MSVVPHLSGLYFLNELLNMINHEKLKIVYHVFNLNN